jgi:hypothetical protein
MDSENGKEARPRKTRPLFYSSSREIPGHAFTTLALLFLAIVVIYMHFMKTKRCPHLYRFQYWHCAEPVERALDDYYKCFLVILASLRELGLTSRGQVRTSAPAWIGSGQSVVSVPSWRL